MFQMRSGREAPSPVTTIYHFSKKTFYRRLFKLRGLRYKGDLIFEEVKGSGALSRATTEWVRTVVFYYRSL